METLFLICAVAGGVVMVCQFLLSMAGLGGDHDVGLDHHIEFGGHAGDAHPHGGGGHSGDATTWFFHALSFRSLVAAITFLGLGGLAAASSPIMAPFAFPIGLAAGACAMVVVAWLMKTLHGLQSEGTVQIESAVGTMGSVYLTIPAAKAGVGKVTVKVQNRTMEYAAVTAHPEMLKTGTPVVVVGVAGPDTVEVGPEIE